MYLVRKPRVFGYYFFPARAIVKSDHGIVGKMSEFDMFKHQAFPSKLVNSFSGHCKQYLFNKLEKTVLFSKKQVH